MDKIRFALFSYWKHLIVFIGSFLSLGNLIILMGILWSLTQTLDNPNIAPLKSISSGFSDPDNVLILFSIITVSLIQGIFSKLIYNLGGKFNLAYAFCSFIFGGIGLHLFIIVGFFIIKKINCWKTVISKQTKLKTIKLLKITSISFLLVPFALISFSSSKLPYGGVINIEKIRMSTNNSAPNLIEVFSDGLDGNELFNYFKLNRNKLKDFIFFKKVLTSSQFTSTSIKAIYQGFKAYEYLINNKLDYSWTLVGSKLRHFQEMQKLGKYNTFINWGTYGDTYNEDNFVQNTSGSVNIFNKSKLNIKSYNFPSMKFDILKGWGLSTLGVDTTSYRVLPKKIIGANKVTNGAHILISDEMVHGPLATNMDGSFSAGLTSLKNSTIGWINEVDMMLKHIPQNIYDNSLIILWSDHGSHANRPYSFKNKSQSNKPWGAFLIKLPHTSHRQLKIVNNRLIYSPYIRNILNFCIKKQQITPSLSIENSFLNFINTDNHFNPLLSKPLLIQSSKFLLISFKNDFPQISKENPQFNNITTSFIKKYQWDLS